MSVVHFGRLVQILIKSHQHLFLVHYWCTMAISAILARLYLLSLALIKDNYVREGVGTLLPKLILKLFDFDTFLGFIPLIRRKS